MQASQNDRKRRHTSPGITRGSDPINDQIAREAGFSLLNTIIALYAERKITARDMCVLCHYANECNCPGGDFAKHAGAPGKPTGAYQAPLLS